MSTFWDMRPSLTPKNPKKQEKATDPAGSATEPLSVSQLAGRIGDALAAGLPGTVRVRGELSEWNPRFGGHSYFQLKDDRSVVSGVMYLSNLRSLTFTPKAGDEVVAEGEVNFWAKGGRLSLIVRSLQPVGQGSLEAAYRQLVEKLRNEGLFEPAHKRPLPLYPKRIAIVTSRDGAALQDVLKVLAPFRHLRPLIVPVPVQGNGAAERIKSALHWLESQAIGPNAVDIILLVRGGGSREDLWAFNEEPVVRAVAELSIPLVTGIGHQTDTSIADFAADERCHTPTEAAQRIVMHWRRAPDRVDQLGIVLRRSLRTTLQHARQRLSALSRHELFRRPGDLADVPRQAVDDLGRRLHHALRQRQALTLRRLHEIELVLQQNAPLALLRLHRQTLTTTQARLARTLRLQSAQQQRHLATLTEHLAKSTAVPMRASRQRLAQAERGFARVSPANQVSELRDILENRLDRLTRAQRDLLTRAQQRRLAFERQLAALGPENVLQRGYSITFADGRVVRSASQVAPGETVTTRTADGEIRSVVADE